MKKKLAIKGHLTRGNEVIELLEMMGGVAATTKGFRESYCYYISEDTATNYISWDYIGPEEIDKYQIFTLEEFLDKYPFKVNDKVIDVADGCPGVVSEMKWDADVSDMKYCVVFGNGIDFGWYANDSIEFCKENKNLEEKQVNPMKNVLAELLEHIKTTPKEELEREFEEIEEWSNVGPTVEEFMDFCNKVNKKPVYPKTYDECCKNVLRMVHWGMTVDVPMHYSPLIINFTKLLICRDAYWKIAGDELRLGRRWEPDWTNENQPKYGLYNELKYSIINPSQFVFPTIEMRDTFYKNFDYLIEACK